MQGTPVTPEQLLEMYQNLQLKYLTLKNEVKSMLDTQQAYFKSNKDIHLLKKAKALESSVREMIDPKPKQVSQASIDFLGR